MIRTIIIEDENASINHLIDLLGKSNLDMKVEAVLPMKFDSYYVSMLSEKYKNLRRHQLPIQNLSYWYWPQ